MRFRRFLLCMLVMAVSSARSNAAEPAIDYARQVKPILASKCLACHGPDEATRKAGLRLDTREGALAMTESGDLAIVAGEPAKSELLDRIAHAERTGAGDVGAGAGGPHQLSEAF